MKIKFLALLTALVTMSSVAFASDVPKININGEELVTNPSAIVVENRVLLPMRAIFESLGATLVWDQENQSVIAARNGVIILVQLGNNEMFVGEEKVTLDVTPMAVEERTMLPLRAISEALDVSVDWVKDTNEVNITF